MLWLCSVLCFFGVICSRFFLLNRMCLWMLVFGLSSFMIVSEVMDLLYFDFFMSDMVLLGCMEKLMWLIMLMFLWCGKEMYRFCILSSGVVFFV